MKRNVTMRDIAERLGVSSVTVSKALNDKEGVSPELKTTIKNLAEEMGYRLNTMAKSMKDGLSYNIGIIVAERFTGPGESFYLMFYQHISRILEQYQYSGILQILTSEDEEQLNLPRVYKENKVDGFIVLGQISRGYVDLLQHVDVPIVFLDFYTDQFDIDYVITDNFYGVYEITNYLIKSGHTDIAFVGNLQSTSSIQDRFLGYYKSLLEHKMKLKDEFIINDRDEKGKFIEMELPDKLPSAFVCNNDQIAFNLINQLKNQGLNVPEDCSVVGFDNDIYAKISDPKITTVEVDMEGMSKMAVKMIVQKVKDSNEKFGRILVKGKIIFRDSVKQIKTR